MEDQRDGGRESRKAESSSNWKGSRRNAKGKAAASRRIGGWERGLGLQRRWRVAELKAKREDGKRGLTLARATAGKLSQASCASSPVFPWRWPERILAAVRVLIPIPSPTKRTTPLATPPGGVVPLTLELAADARIRASIARVAASYQTSRSENRNFSSTEWPALCYPPLGTLLRCTVATSILIESIVSKRRRENRPSLTTFTVRIVRLTVFVVLCTGKRLAERRLFCKPNTVSRSRLRLGIVTSRTLFPGSFRLYRLSMSRRFN